MLNLDHFETLCSRLQIKHRDSGQMVPFHFNPSQQKIMQKVRAYQRKRRHLWLIFLTARRLGISRWTAARPRS